MTVADMLGRPLSAAAGNDASNGKPKEHDE